MEKINTRNNEPVDDYRISVATGDDGVIKTVFVNDQEFESARSHGSIHTRLNQMDDKIEKMRNNIEKDNECHYLSVPHGNADYFQHICSECGHKRYDCGLPSSYKYCPNCGRKIVR